MTLFASEFMGIFREIGQTIYNEPSILWQIAPVFILWVVLEIYFGKYNHEELGWNSALANGVSIFWIVLSAFQVIFATKSDDLFNFWPVFLALILIMFYAILIIVISFKHSLKSKWAYLIAAPTPIYYLSIISLFLAHNAISLNFISLIFIFVMFLFCALIFYIVRLLTPNAISEEDSSTDSFKDDFKSDAIESDTDFSSPASSDSFREPSDLESGINDSFSSQANPFEVDNKPTTNPFSNNF